MRPSWLGGRLLHGVPSGALLWQRSHVLEMRSPACSQDVPKFATCQHTSPCEPASTVNIMLAELCRRSCKIFWSPGSNHFLRRLQQFLDKWTKMHVVMSQRWTPNVRVGHGSSGSSRAICASVACTRLGRHDPEECSSCSPSPMATARKNLAA